MVAQMRSLSPDDLLDRFVASNEGLLKVVSSLDDRGWTAPAETPAGHVPIRLVAHHALWDCWIHERDIALPLRLTPPTEADEVRSCLRYVSAFSAAVAISSGSRVANLLAVEAASPTSCFVLDLGQSATVRDEVLPHAAPRLRGDAVALVEALSIRAPLPESTPADWLQLRSSLATLFTSDRR